MGWVSFWRRRWIANKKRYFFNKISLEFTRNNSRGFRYSSCGRPSFFICRCSETISAQFRPLSLVNHQCKPSLCFHNGATNGWLKIWHQFFPLLDMIVLWKRIPNYSLITLLLVIIVFGHDCRCWSCLKEKMKALFLIVSTILGFQTPVSWDVPLT